LPAEEASSSVLPPAFRVPDPPPPPPAVPVAGGIGVVGSSGEAVDMAPV
jgi:hypothetical protein